MTGGLPTRVIEVSRRPIYDVALAISIVVLGGNTLWTHHTAWLLPRRLLLAMLTALVVNALIDVVVDQRFRMRLVADPEQIDRTPRVVGPLTRVAVMGAVLLATFAVASVIPGNAPLSLSLAGVGLGLVLALGLAERRVTRLADVEARRASDTSVADATFAALLLSLCTVDVALAPSITSARMRLFALLLIAALVVVVRSVDATIRQRRAILVAFNHAQTRAHQAISSKGRNWGSAEDPAREGAWATRAILDALDLSEGLKVADVGAGAGFFTRKLCERVGPSGTVHATDRDLWAVSRLRELGEERGFTQLHPTHVDSRVPLPISERVDRMLMVNVGLFSLAREEEGRALLEDFAAKILPGGLLVIYQEFVHEAGWRSEPGLPALSDTEPDAEQVIAWSVARFELIDRPALPPPERPYGEREREGYLLVLRRR